MPNPSQVAFLEALGWTILNSWWQFGVLWLASLFLKKVSPKASAAMRYNLSIAVLFSGLCWIILSCLLRYNSLLAGGYQVISIPADTLHRWYRLINSSLINILPYISIVYLFWLGVNLIRFTKSVRDSQELKRRGLTKAPVEWRVFVGEMVSNMNIKETVQLWISTKIDTPMIIGWVKPVILLPAAAFTQLNTNQLEAILIHELAHIRRNDYFWNIIVSLAEQVLFFNPFVRWIIQDIRAERELSCDDWVLQFPYHPEQYAHALLQLEHQRIGKQHTMQLAARGSHRKLLLTRVQRMLNLPQAKSPNPGRFAAMMILALLLGLAGLLKPRQEISQLIDQSIRFPIASWETSYNPPAKARQVAVPVAFVTRSAKSRQKNPGAADANSSLVQETEEQTTVNALQLIPTSESDYTGDSEPAFPAYATEERAYSLLDEPVQQPVFTENLPYVPRSSFQAIRQRDSLIPEDILVEKLAAIQEKEASLQLKLAEVQDSWEKLAKQQIAGNDLNEVYIKKKAELENLQKQVEKQARQFTQIAEKQARMRQEQIQKSPRKRKIVHI